MGDVLMKSFATSRRSLLTTSCMLTGTQAFSDKESLMYLGKMIC